MAQRVIRACDFDKPKRGGGTVKCGREFDGDSTIFDFDGRRYEVDLCEEHKAALYESMKPFTSIARASNLPPAKTLNGRGRLVHKSRVGAFTSKDVRKWLAEQGREVAPVGRIPNSLIEEYKQAQASA